ncbi:MAG: TolC family protein [Elusimicrobia bacterium]|nr:TolC family protein [Elusimicrobiota bacterium]
MQKNVFFISLLFSSFVRAENVQVATGPLTLDACYRLALERSESVGLSEEDVRRGEAQYAQLRSGILPSVGFRATEKFQDTAGSPSSANGTLVRGDQVEASFYGKQTIFAGFREFAAMKGQKEEIAARQETVSRSKILLYEDVAGLFFTIADRDQEMESLQNLIRLSTDRVQELKKRLAIGRSRESEILSTESQAANLESRWESARGFREAALAVLNTLLRAQVTAIMDDQPDAVAPASIDRYLERVAQRPDVRSAESRRLSRAQFVKSARRIYLPTLDLTGNYYVKRVGANEPIDWDALFSLNAPFYTGGQTQSLVRLAESDERTAALQLSQVRRDAEGEVRERHRNLLSLLSQMEKLKRSADLAERNYTVQRNEYRLGLVNNLDVLAALNTWQDTQLALDTVRLAAKNVSIRLELAAGSIPEVLP